jgi:hypothetical protein
MYNQTRGDKSLSGKDTGAGDGLDVINEDLASDGQSMQQTPGLAYRY